MPESADNTADSHYGFGQLLRTVPGVTMPVGGQLQELARQAADEMPTNAALRDEIIAAAAEAASIAKETEEWGPAWSAANARTRERVHNPHNDSPRMEEKDDSGPARRQR